MAEYRYTGWYKGQHDEPYSYISIQSASDEEAWGRALPANFICAKLERFDGEGWEELRISEEEFFGALKEVITGITARKRPSHG